MTHPRTEVIHGALSGRHRHRKLKFFCVLWVLTWGVAARAAIPIYDFEIVHTYPHDTSAFTEGLFYLNGFLYESTGLERHSSIRKVRIETGEVVQKIDIPAQYFGEGIVNWRSHLISLTWKSQIGFVFDLNTFKLQRQFKYPGEGWALTRNDKQIIMSDGTSELRFLNPDTLAETSRIQVSIEGKPLMNVNELEWVKGEIYANVWQTNWIARIDPSNGKVVGLINLSGLLKQSDVVKGQTDVLNGIAYDAKQDRLFVTGKNWPKLFEIRLHKAGETARTDSPHDP
jgi:glutaminyl-peptide cyclotransferase